MPSDRCYYSPRRDDYEHAKSDEVEKFLDKLDPFNSSTRPADVPMVTHRDHHRGRRHHMDDSRGYHHSYSDPGSAGRYHGGHEDCQKSHSRGFVGNVSGNQIITSAAMAAAVEALAARHDKDRIIRVTTAAAAAAAVDAAVGKKLDGKSVRHMAESTVAGLAINRLINGKRRHK